jgi:hypothetical protein
MNRPGKDITDPFRIVGGVIVNYHDFHLIAAGRLKKGLKTITQIPGPVVGADDK